MNHLTDPSLLRRRLWLACIASAVLLVYASIVPLQFRAFAWEDAVTRFQQTPWLNLNVGQRADWIANALAVMPMGFFAAGALFFQRRLNARSIALMLGFVLCTATLVVGIEFAQIWFPPRTVSQNDIFAGWVGGILGPLAWPGLGAPGLAVWLRIRDIRLTPQNRPQVAWWLLLSYLTLLTVYSILPLDLILTRQEWLLKWETGRFVMFPGAEFLEIESWRDLLGKGLGLGMAGVRMIPIGFLLHFVSKAKPIRLVLIGTPLFIEVIQAPVFTRFSSLTEVWLGWAGGFAGLMFARQLGTLQRWNHRMTIRALVVGLLATGIAAGFCLRFDEFASMEEMQLRFAEMWTAPLVRYYYGTEFGAGANLLGKLLAFGVLGVGLCNLCRCGSTPPVCKRGGVLGFIFVLVLGLGIETAQLFLKPLVPDACDVLTYLIGAWIGYQGWRVMTTFLNVPIKAS